MKVEIYIQTKTKNPAIQKTAQARWLIQSVSTTGQVSSRDGVVCINNATSKRAALSALETALSRFQKAAVIKIYIFIACISKSGSNHSICSVKNKLLVNLISECIPA